MSKIFLSTHGKMASGMKSSIEILMGGSDNLVIYDAYVEGTNTSLKDEVEKFLASCESTETKLLISDMYGGSVNQTLTQYSTQENVFVITGITLSLLLELLTQCSDNFTKERLEELIEKARNLTRLVSLEFEVSGDDFF